MFKKYYSHFLKVNEGIQHYASHGHHFWPDITRAATLEYWEDSAKYLDNKWDYFATTKIPETQTLITHNLKLSNPSQIVFGSNTHEFVFRIISCFSSGKKIKILTSDSEFFSFERQINRLSEENLVTVVRVPTLPFDDFQERFIKELQQTDYDLIFLSHVFYNSGMAIKNLETLVNSVRNKETMIVIDGYHSFMAIPTDLSKIEDRIFYLAGSYKYAQGGEGCCFMHVPKTSQHRPVHTGWFAGPVGYKDNRVSYYSDARKFAGATMDFAPLYRLNAVLKMFKHDGITVEKIHQHIQKLQTNFREHLLLIDHPFLAEKNIISVDYNYHGHFYAFALPSTEHASNLCDELKKLKIITNYRDNRLRFGFGLYHEDCIDLTALKFKR